MSPADEYLFLVLVTPVGPYFKQGFSPTKLVVEEEFDCAAPLGVGTAKAGGNYAAGMRATVRAQSKGYGEALYLDSQKHKFIDELGAANFFGITKDKAYVTPNSPSILRSITNLSLRTLAADLGYSVEERPVSSTSSTTFVETGACGTAAVITPIESITYRDRTIVYLKDGKPGPHCTALYEKVDGNPVRRLARRARLDAGNQRVIRRDSDAMKLKPSRSNSGSSLSRDDEVQPCCEHRSDLEATGAPRPDDG